MEMEALELFRIVDVDNSGDVSVAEVRDAVRDVAPSTTLEGFWQRLAAEWPEIKSLAHKVVHEGSKEGHRRACEIIAELLPTHVQHQCTPPRLLGCEAPVLATLTLEAFDAIAAHLDISSRNAADLFDCIIAASRKGQSSVSLPNVTLNLSAQPVSEDSLAGGGNGELSLDSSMRRECYMEDFLEQMYLWVDNPLGFQRSDDAGCIRRERALQHVMHVSVLAKEKINALKAELTPLGQGAPVVTRARLKDSSNRRKRKNKAPKIPWVSSCAAKHSLLPIHLC